MELFITIVSYLLAGFLTVSPIESPEDVTACNEANGVAVLMATPDAEFDQAVCFTPNASALALSN